MGLQHLNKANGCLKIDYQLDEVGRQSCRAYQQEPLRVLFPRMGDGRVPGGIIINTSGGVVGGDTHTIDVTLGQGTKALMTTQAAEKIYASPSSSAHINTCITAQKDSWLEWIPQETILFNESRLRRTISFHVDPSSTIMGGEILILGRVNRGETFQNGFLQDQWSVYLEKDLIWRDVLRLDTHSLDALNHPAGFNKATAYGTFIYVTSAAEDTLKLARHFLGHCKTQSSATAFKNLILVRWLSPDPLQLRRDYAQFWRFWRHRMAALPKTLPRIWYF